MTNYAINPDKVRKFRCAAIDADLAVDQHAYQGRVFSLFWEVGMLVTIPAEARSVTHLLRWCQAVHSEFRGLTGILTGLPELCAEASDIDDLTLSVVNWLPPNSRFGRMGRSRAVTLGDYLFLENERGKGVADTRSARHSCVLPQVVQEIRSEGDPATAEWVAASLMIPV